MPRLVAMDDDGRSIGQLIREGERSISFEFMPPKDEAGVEQLWSAIRDLEPYQPTFVSVTYGAGGTTRDTTVAITGRIARETSLRAMGHLTCVGHTREELADILQLLPRRRRPRRAGAARRPEGGPARAVDADPGRPDLRQRAGRAGPRDGRLQHRRGGLPGGPPVGRVQGRRRAGAGGQGRRGRRVRGDPAVLPRLRLRRPRRAGPRAAAATSRSCPGIMPITNLRRSPGWPSCRGPTCPTR